MKPSDIFTLAHPKETWREFWDGYLKDTVIFWGIITLCVVVAGMLITVIVLAMME